MHKLSILLASSIVLTTSALAQSGDKKDKNGEVQHAPIPADQIPPAPPLSPEQALKTFRLPPGFEAQIVASEPLIDNPVVVQWDSAGRLWVMEMRT